MPKGHASSPIRVALVVLCACSGCSALVYEIVWFQLLQLVIGSSAISIGILLATFMGGLCLGSFGVSRVVSTHVHPLRAYALFELGIAALGAAVFVIAPYAGGLYIAIGGTGFSGILVRSVISACCMLPPTMLMGATLPALARWTESSGTGILWCGLFYAGNIAGAIVGSLAAGFYLLRVYDMAWATGVAAGLNIAVALTAFLLAARAPYTPYKGCSEYSAPQAGVSEGGWTVYVAIALSGLCALSAQVVWVRLLSLMLGPSVYTFSIILAVFLLGLGLGSAAGSVLSCWSANVRRDLGICQMLLPAAIAWSAYMIDVSLPYWPVDPFLAKSSWSMFQLDLFRCGLVVLPATALWGASFPLALAAAAGPGKDPGRLVGGIYAANTIGAIAGALGCSVLFIEWFGSQHTQQALIVLSAAAALVVLQKDRLLSAGAVLAIALMFTVAPVPAGLIAYGRFLPRNLALANAQTTQGFAPNIPYAAEGITASVAVSAAAGGAHVFHVNGRVEASTQSQDMRLQRMLGHLSALYDSEPRSVLIVGFGAGVTAGTFTLYRSVDKIVICEIEPLIPQNAAQYFSNENYNVLGDPRVQVVYDDARHYMLTSEEKFDVITSDPVHPWIKGAAALYTQEYFELAKSHLRPGGVMSQWVPLYETSLEAVKSEVATFLSVFPNGTIWGNDVNGVGYDVMLMAKEADAPIDLEGLHQRLNRPDHLKVANSLKEVGFGSVIELLATYLGRASDLVSWRSDAEINRDRNLRLQYLAGMGMNLSQNGAIYNDLLAYRRFPQDLFIGSVEVKKALRDALARTPSLPTPFPAQ